MPYERNDLNNDPAAVQPASNDITLFGGSEGWTTINHKDWNGDYSKRNIANGTVVPGVYSKRDIANSVVTPSAYQRRDTDNNAVSL
jgi:hypothetical protein